MKKPKENNYPLTECLQVAQRAREDGFDIHQKWTCSHCGARQTMAMPNIFYTSGECEECKNTSQITECNFMAISMGLTRLQ